MKIGVIGCGGAGELHIGAYAEKHDVVAISDINSEAIEDICKNHNIPNKFYGEDSYRKVLDMDLDGISICLPPNETKHKVMKQCIERGINILVEKPLTYDLQTAEELARRWDRDNMVFAVCYNWRNTFLMRKFRELAKNGRYGRLRHLSVEHYETYDYWNPSSFYTQIGYVLEHNCHDINYMRYINGDIKTIKVTEIGGMPGRLPRNPSLLTVFLEYENGTTGVFRSANGTGKPRRIKVVGDFDGGKVAGHLSYKNPDYEWRDISYFRIFGPDGEIFGEHTWPLPGDDSDIRAGKISWMRVNEQGYNGIYHANIIDDFAKAVQDGNPLRSNVIDGYEDIKAIYAVFKSIETGERVCVK